MDESYIYVNTKSELKRLIEDGVIKSNIIISGEHISKLVGVEKIEGSIGLNDSSISNLCDLKSVSGDLWLYSRNSNSPLFSLGKLEKVGGDLILRYSNIRDLGLLTEVGKKCTLRDSPIENLGNLTNVGGDLFLPKRLESKVDVAKLKVGGVVRYWNDSKKKTKTDSIKLKELQDSSVPQWEKRYIYSYEDLFSANAEQISFYSTFKTNFLDGVYFNLHGNNNYAFVLLYDLLRDAENNIYSEEYLAYLKNLEKYYPATKSYIESALIETFNKKNDYEASWQIYQSADYVSVEKIIDYEAELGRSLLNAEIITTLAGYSHLTRFGQDNILRVKDYIIQEFNSYCSEKNARFFDVFLTKDISSNKYIVEPLENYKRFFLLETEYNFYKKIDDQQKNLIRDWKLPHVVEKAIINQLRLIIRKAEDFYRSSIGMPKVGEGWISETELFYKIRTSFPNYEVQHHGSPRWLGRQHLDIYIPEFNIAIEYQGDQHYTAIDFFGGKEALESTQNRDKIKRQKCEENGCHLIYVHEGYDFEEIRLQVMAEIQKRNTSM